MKLYVQNDTNTGFEAVSIPEDVSAYAYALAAIGFIVASAVATVVVLFG